MHYAFVDFDGVLNSIESTIAYHALGIETRNHLNVVSVGLLKHLCIASGAKIVVSSSWRIGRTVQDLVDCFARVGWHNAPIIDVTGRGDYGQCRGDEIQLWLDTNTTPDDNYVILDDDSDMLPAQKDHFIHTPGANGFTLQHLCHAMHIFGVADHDFEEHAFFHTPKPY